MQFELFGLTFSVYKSDKTASALKHIKWNFLNEGINRVQAVKEIRNLYLHTSNELGTLKGALELTKEWKPMEDFR